MNLRFVLRDGKRILQSYEKISTGWLVPLGEPLSNGYEYYLPRQPMFEYKWVDVPLVEEEDEKV